jgi:hypothetical protein
MKVSYKIGMFLFAFLINITISTGQTYSFDEFDQIKFFEGSYYLFTYNNDIKVLGQYIEKKSDNLIAVSNGNSMMDVNLYDIKKVRIIDRANLQNENYWFPNPLSTNYGINSSAFTSGHLKGNIQSMYVFLMNCTLGLTDYFDVTAGGFPYLYYSYGFRIGNIKISENLFLGAYYQNMNFGPYSIQHKYALLTYGTRNNNLTLGVGTYSNDENFRNQKLRNIQANGMYRLFEKFSILTENMLNLGENENYSSTLILRFLKRKWIIDIGGVYNSPLIFGGGTIPYLSISYKF